MTASNPAVRPFSMRTLCAALIMAFPALVEAAVAGRVQFVAGDVRVVDAAGRELPMKKGQDINEGDTVLSAQGGSAQLKMIDGAIVAVRPATQLKIVGYVFNGKEDGTENASFSLFKGGLRAITGLIGRTNKDRYKLETPTVVIGIRGTDHEPVVILPPGAGQVASAPPGTYDKVNVGATSMTTQVGTTVVAANQVGFAASPTQLPVILPKMPDFYRATPAPQAKQEEKQEQEQKQEAQASSEQASSEQASSAESAQGETTAEAVGTVTEAVATVAEAVVDTVTANAPANNLTATDSSGNTLDLANQTLITSTGEEVNIGDNTGTVVDPGTRPLEPHTEVIAVYPHPADTQTPGEVFHFPAVYYFDGPTSAVGRDAAGNLTGASDMSVVVEDYRSSLTQNGSTLADLVKDAATGLSWGRWQGGQITHSYQHVGMDASGRIGLGAEDASGNFVIGATYSNSVSLGNNSLHWIAGPSSAPWFLSQILTGKASYTMIGGTRPTDTLGNTGTLNSASLAANFTTQTVDASVNFTIGGNTWGMQSSGMPLDDTHFNSFSNCDAANCGSTVSITKNGTVLASSPTPTLNNSFGFGSMNGALTGAGLNGAALQYAVQETTVTSQPDSSGNPVPSFTHNLVQGVVGFSGPTQDVNTPFRAVAVIDGWSGDGQLLDGEELAELAAAGIYRGDIEGGIAAVSKVVDSASGLSEFVGTARGYTPASGTTDSSLYYRDVAATIKVGTAVNRDVGSTTVSGITVSWGRWEGGNVDIYSRDGSTKLGTIDNSGRNIHWLSTSALNSQMFSLPLTGTATYAVAGNTSPTDLHGNVGKLTSATLTADFANQKVNAGINVSFEASNNSATWSIASSNIPLASNGEFHSNSALHGASGISHTATCSGTGCGTQTFGRLSGHFVAGAQGAVMAYGMMTGTPGTNGGASLTNAVNGLVVMKK
ncbi:MAG TPA: FecR domain-containing protein [Paucimonas sp.]|nr:FecR domain-containing protein [Paucimonas sp.]